MTSSLQNFSVNMSEFYKLYKSLLSKISPIKCVQCMEYKLLGPYRLGSNQTQHVGHFQWRTLHPCFNEYVSKTTRRNWLKNDCFGLKIQRQYRLSLNYVGVFSFRIFYCEYQNETLYLICSWIDSISILTFCHLLTN